MADAIGKCGTTAASSTGIRRSSRPPALPDRSSETSRPNSGTRLKTAAPMLPPAMPKRPRALSVVERHMVEPFVCQSTNCVANADVTVRANVGAVEVVVLFCRACGGKLPAELRAVPISKEPR